MRVGQGRALVGEEDGVAGGDDDSGRIVTEAAALTGPCREPLVYTLVAVTPPAPLEVRRYPGVHRVVVLLLRMATVRTIAGAASRLGLRLDDDAVTFTLCACMGDDARGPLSAEQLRQYQEQGYLIGTSAVRWVDEVVL